MMPIQPPRQATEVYMSEFEAMWDYKGFWQGIWHPFVTGRPARLRYLARMVEEMQKKGGVWSATLEEIAKHLKWLVDEGTYKSRGRSSALRGEPNRAVGGGHRPLARLKSFAPRNA